MSKKKSSKKRSSRPAATPIQEASASARAATPRTRTPKSPVEELTFGRQTFIWMAAGVGLMALGMLLMMGGEQPPNEWDPSEIYSFRRTVLAPLVILSGLGVVWYAIAKK
jgi:hypothetical protein